MIHLFQRCSVRGRKKMSTGMALLIALSVITILITVGLELNQKVYLAAESTAANRDQFTLEQMAVSGIHAAMAMLVKDKMESQIDSIQEDWAQKEKIAEVLQAIPFQQGNLDVVITDELGRIQINSLVDFEKGQQFNQAQYIMWDRFLRAMKLNHESFEDLEVGVILDAIKDWIDSDDNNSGMEITESNYYETLDPPYECPNRPIVNVAELRMIRGMIPELFQGVEDLPGIADFLTSFGMVQKANKFAYPGKININTADLPVLVAMVPENPECGQAMYEYREEKEDDHFVNSLTSPTWYKQVTGCGDVTIEPSLIRLTSDLFRIQATATLGKLHYSATAVVVREKNKNGKYYCKIVRWEAN